MAQARREPRFSEIEVLPPAQAVRTAALCSIDAQDICDAVFETLPGQAAEPAARRPPHNAPLDAGLPGLGLLKQNTGSHASAAAERAGMTPGFAAFTVLAALAVFWLCGGHALLY